MRIKICRKEGKETQFWLQLFETNDSSIDKKRLELLQEALELTKIFGAILEHSK